MKNRACILSILLALSVLFSTGCGILFLQTDPDNQESPEDEDKPSGIVPQTKTDRDVLAPDLSESVRRKQYETDRKLQAKLDACKYDLDLTGVNIGEVNGHFKSQPEKHGFYYHQNGKERHVICLLDPKCLKTIRSSSVEKMDTECEQRNRCCDITVD